jgi:hypothetical protein
MSTDRDTTRIVRSWLRTEENESADRVLGTVLDRLDTTPQRHASWWPARRLSTMNNVIKYGLTATVVAAAALLGFNFLVAPNVGSPNDGRPSERPGASISAELPLLTEQDGPLQPGTYVVTEVEPLRLAITVPAGWSRNVAPSTVWTEDSTVNIWFGRVENLYVDPCGATAEQLDPSLGPTVEDLAAALAAYPGVDARVDDISVSGFRGTSVELSVSDPIDGWCAADARLWDIELGARMGLTPFATLRAWIFDVNGDRLVLAASVRSAATPADTEGLERIIDSLQIEAP